MGEEPKKAKLKRENAPGKRARGTRLREKDWTRLLKLCEAGASPYDAAKELGISREVVRRKLNDPAFRARYDQVTEADELEINRSLHRAATVPDAHGRVDTKCGLILRHQRWPHRYSHPNVPAAAKIDADTRPPPLPELSPALAKRMDALVREAILGPAAPPEEPDSGTVH